MYLVVVVLCKPDFYLIKFLQTIHDPGKIDFIIAVQVCKCKEDVFMHLP